MNGFGKKSTFEVVAAAHSSDEEMIILSDLDRRDVIPGCLSCDDERTFFAQTRPVDWTPINYRFPPKADVGFFSHVTVKAAYAYMPMTRALTGRSAMQLTPKRTAQITGLLLLFAAVTQAIYTALYLSEAEVPRQLLWGTEGFLFLMMAAFAGSALVQFDRQQLAWSAIAAASVLNVVQVGVGLTMFGPFFEVAGEVEALAPAASAVVAFSFMVYNAAKVLLALALIVFGSARRKAGSQLLGGVSVVVGIVALVSNTASMAAGRDVFGELPLAGGSGVTATVLLAVCLLSLPDTAAEGN